MFFQVINNVKTLGKQLGILKDEDEEEEEEEQYWLHWSESELIESLMLGNVWVFVQLIFWSYLAY